MDNSTYDPSFYRILCVGEKATKKEIRAAYIGQLKIYHPDKNPNDLAWTHEQTQMLNIAYEILSDEVKRTNYDNLLQAFRMDQALKKKQAEQKKQSEQSAKKGAPRPYVNPNAFSNNSAQEAVGGLFGLAALGLLIWSLSQNGKK